MATPRGFRRRWLRQQHQLRQQSRAACIGFVALGLLDFETAASQTRYRQVFEPRPAYARLYEASFDNFQEIYRRLRPLYQRLNQVA